MLLGGASPAAHSGQSKAWLSGLVVGVSPSSADAISVMAPAPEQINSKAGDLTIGEATAAAIDNTNPTSTKRAMA
jgi:hypothetical protein